VDIPSYQVEAGDEIEVKDAVSSRQLATRALDETRARTIPDWMTLAEDTFKGKINRLPTRDEIEVGINEQLIVEFYNR
jgi:small subunit ribosomal protein S4